MKTSSSTGASAQEDLISHQLHHALAQVYSRPDLDEARRQARKVTSKIAASKPDRAAAARAERAWRLLDDGGVLPAALAPSHATQPANNPIVRAALQASDILYEQLELPEDPRGARSLHHRSLPQASWPDVGMVRLSLTRDPTWPGAVLEEAVIDVESGDHVELLRVRVAPSLYVEMTHGQDYDDDGYRPFCVGTAYFAPEKSLDDFVASRPQLRATQSMMQSAANRTRDGTRMLQARLNEGVSPDTTVDHLRHGRSALVTACAAGALNNVHLLLKAGAFAGSHPQDVESPLSALIASDAACEALSADNPGVLDPDEIDDDAFVDATMDDVLKALNALIEAGADLSHGGLRGVEPLRDACARWNMPVIKALLEAGADPHAKDDKGQSVRQYCLEGNRAEPAALIDAWLLDQELRRAVATVNQAALSAHRP